MKQLYTIPDSDYIVEVASKVPDYMSPNTSPYALVGEGVLSDEGCDAILSEMLDLPSYRFEHCDATTREAIRPLSKYFQAVIEFTLQANAACWGFDIEEESSAGYLQSYTMGDCYQTHMDGVLGQTRKLTTVVMLSEPDMYQGGQLRVIPYPMSRVIPKTRGTMVTFPGWIFHEVLPVTKGTRQTLNLGMWGPPWK